jgi:hypothetical protein
LNVSAHPAAFSSLALEALIVITREGEVEPEGAKE